MDFNPADVPANFNLAVESLKETLQHEQNAVAALSLRADNPPDSRQPMNGARYSAGADRGFSVDTDA